jgi:hypothetical protein
MSDMIRCHKCQTFHYGNDPCSHEPDPEFIRFDAWAWVVVHLRPNSGVVQMTSNIADETCAKRYAQQIELDGGHVFAVLPAGVVVGALQIPKKNLAAAKRAAQLKRYRKS